VLAFVIWLWGICVEIWNAPLEQFVQFLVGLAQVGVTFLIIWIVLKKFWKALKGLL
jgi:hypothetical protein